MGALAGDSVRGNIDLFLEGLSSDSKCWLSLQSKPFSPIRTMILLATGWALYQKYSRTFYLLLDTEFVRPFSKRKSFLCCRYPFTEIFSPRSGKVEGWLSSWKSRYPVSAGSYPGVLNLSVLMLLVFCFTCMICVINCTASLLCYKDFY